MHWYKVKNVYFIDFVMNRLCNMLRILGSKEYKLSYFNVLVGMYVSL